MLSIVIFHITMSYSDALLDLHKIITRLQEHRMKAETKYEVKIQEDLK